jgi:hypothetical protein
MGMKKFACCICYGFLWFLLLPEHGVLAQPYQPVNTKATKETKALYHNLQKVLGEAVLFGHQDDLAYGIGWAYESGNSDVKKVTGDYPALYGWELGNLELDSAKNLDNVPFATMKQFIRDGYKQGSVISISWHANNPLTGKNAWDPQAGTVASILEGGSKHALFITWLDKVADFLGDLKDEKGVAIPVLFRPWHELTGNWFWWCQNLCTPDEFKQLWKLTYDHLVNKRKLNNLLWVYNTADFNNTEQFLVRYPGNQFADVISFDAYQNENQISSVGNTFVQQVDARLSLLNTLADSLQKIPALAETGFEAIPQINWWTNDLLPLLNKHRVSYVLLWRNAGKMPGKEKMHYYVPFEGDLSAKDFKAFVADPKIWMAEDAKKAALYKQK